jgi:hypothetical protein
VTALRQWLDGPRPWHLLLGPAVPLLALLKNNSSTWPPEVVIGPVLITAGIALLLWLLVVPLAHDPLRAALAVTFSMLVVMSHLPLLLVALSLGIVRFIPLVYLGVLVAAAAIVRSRRAAIGPTMFANRALLITVLFLVVPIAWGEVGRARTVAEPLRISPEARAGQRPDVYVLILDGYGRADVLRDLYGFDNPLPDKLRASGFVVADRATANYAQTALSLASAFNLDYLPQLGHPERADTDRKRGLADLIRRSRFFQAFEDAGYDIRPYGSEYTLIRPVNGRGHRAAPGHLNDFYLTMLEATALPTLLEAVGLQRGWLPLRLHRHHLRWTLTDLAESVPPENAPPTLVFAHLLAPHPPFALDADGGIRHTKVPALLDDGSMWRAIARQSGESYKAGYLDSLRYLHDAVLRVEQAIANRPSRPAIVVIHSDHGPGLQLDWESPAGTNMRERMGILAAARFPGDQVAAMDDRISLVNVYRTVLNRALGTGLPLLEDRSYFSTGTRPFAYLDVTDRANCVACPEAHARARTVDGR